MDPSWGRCLNQYSPVGEWLVALTQRRQAGPQRGLLVLVVFLRLVVLRVARKWWMLERLEDRNCREESGLRVYLGRLEERRRYCQISPVPLALALLKLAKNPENEEVLNQLE